MTLYTTKSNGWITAIRVDMLPDNETARERGNRKMWVLMTTEPFRYDQVLQHWESSDGVKATNHLQLD